ncbi:MAG: AsmA family protein [Lentisphaerae bacterium]|nr:AsmA family protein [Lentisphaerota bacterium]
MKKCLKCLAKALGWIILVVAILMVVLLMALPPIAVKVVNTKAGDFVNAEVSLRDIDLNLFRGYVELEGLRVGQPPGFEGDDLLSLRHAHVKIAVRSLLHPPIVINDVRVEGLAMHIIKNSDGVMNVQKLATTPSQPKEEKPDTEKPAAPPPAVALEKLVVNDLNVRYADLSFGDKPLDVGVTELLLTVTDIFFDPSAPVEKVLPGRVELTTKLRQGDEPNAYVGAIARLGVLSTNVPALNAAVRLAGIELGTYDVVLPAGVKTGISTVLGGSCLDLTADISSISPQIRDIDAALVTKSASLPLPMGGSFADIFADINKLIAARLAGQTMAMVGNVGSASMEVAGTAAKSAAAVGKGAGKIVGAFGGGLLKAAKGVATGDLKSVGDGLKDSTVGAVGEAVGTVTNTAMTAVSGVGTAASKGLGMDSANEWRDGVPARWQTSWEAAVKLVDGMPYPTPDKKMAKAATAAEAVAESDAAPEKDAAPEVQPAPEDASMSHEE